MKIPRSLITIGCFLAVSIGAFTLTRFLRPQTTAYAGECVGRTNGALGNVCEKPVVMALCRDSGNQDRREDACVTQTLAKGEGFTATFGTPATGTPYTMACDAPFVPAWRQSYSNANLYQKGCRKPD